MWRSDRMRMRRASRNVRPGAVDAELRSIASEYARFQFEYDPYGAMEAVAEGYGDDLEYKVHETPGYLAELYYGTLTDPDLGVPYAIGIVEREFLPVMPEDDDLRPMLEHVLSRLKAVEPYVRKASKNRKRRASRNVSSLYDDGVLEPGRVRTLDDLREYTMAENPSYARRLNDPTVWSWIRDYYAYVAWNEHGNQPSLADDASQGTLARLVDYLTEYPDPQWTEYLIGYDGPENADPRALGLLERARAIQGTYGAPKASWNRKKGARRCSEAGTSAVPGMGRRSGTSSSMSRDIRTGTMMTSDPSPWSPSSRTIRSLARRESWPSVYAKAMAAEVMSLRAHVPVDRGTIPSYPVFTRKDCSSSPSKFR